MAKRINFRKATEDRVMRTRGIERLDGPPLAEESRHGYRKVMNERPDDPEVALAAISHQTIAKQARHDFGKREVEEWPLIRGSKQLKEQAAERLRRQERLAAKKAQRRLRKKSK